MSTDKKSAACSPYVTMFETRITLETAPTPMLPNPFFRPAGKATLAHALHLLRQSGASATEDVVARRHAQLARPRIRGASASHIIIDDAWSPDAQRALANNGFSTETDPTPMLRNPLYPSHGKTGRSYIILDEPALAGDALWSPPPKPLPRVTKAEIRRDRAEFARIRAELTEFPLRYQGGGTPITMAEYTARYHGPRHQRTRRPPAAGQFIPLSIASITTGETR